MKLNKQTKDFLKATLVSLIVYWVGTEDMLFAIALIAWLVAFAAFRNEDE